MKIAVFSMGPLFPQFVHGGSQKILQTVVTYLGNLGHQCTVYCPRRDDNFEPFQIVSNVLVRPVLRFKQTYPDMYYTAPYNLGEVILTLAQAIDTHDVFYIHDGELAFHFLYSQIPTVVAFHDFVYPDTLAHAFSFKRDCLIVNSTYAQKCVSNIFLLFRKIDEYLSVVTNGFDNTVFRQKDARLLRASLALEDDCIPILYPHRPDPRKGLYEAISTIAASKQYLPQEIFRRMKLLIPTWIDSNVVQDGDHVFQNIYKDIFTFAQEVDVADKLHIHPWIPMHAMPEYYSLGKATLCIGNFVESFGNVSVESELCGTPSIISRVAAQRSILPEEISIKVDYKDIQGAAQLLTRILCEGIQHTDAIREYVSSNYSEQHMVEGYANRILNAKLGTPALDVYKIAWSLQDQISIPPWCTQTASGYYNDYHYDYCQDPFLLSLVERCRTPISTETLYAQGCDEASLKPWVQSGFLLRTPAIS